MKDNLMNRLDYERMMEMNKWTYEIPYIKFPMDWEVKATPPFGGAVIRYRIRKNGRAVSIYLDCYDNLGCVGEPYWEIYPYKGDCFRCVMNETGKLIEAISLALNESDMKE